MMSMVRDASELTYLEYEELKGKWFKELDIDLKGAKLHKTLRHRIENLPNFFYDKAHVPIDGDRAFEITDMHLYFYIMDDYRTGKPKVAYTQVSAHVNSVTGNCLTEHFFIVKLGVRGGIKGISVRSFTYETTYDSFFTTSNYHPEDITIKDITVEVEESDNL